MTIQIPGYLQWVSYLVGSEWPKGDEDAMFRIGNDWRTSSDGMTGLIPELNRMRASTMEVLQGQTAGAADKQFKQLFDGEASVDKLAKAMAALGDLSDGTGKSIEYTKLQILTSLAIAAFEISWALAQTSVTFGASAAAIPVIEGATSITIRQVVAMLMKQIMTDLGKTLTKTTVSRIIKKAGVEMSEAVGQELFVQSIQQSKGHQQGFNWQRVGIVAVANGAGGATQGTVGIVGNRMAAKTGLNPYVSGTLVGYSSGVAKKIVGQVSTGQPVDIVSALGSASTAATGGIRGGRGARASSARAVPDTAAAASS
ncbi:MAG: hypothetical protein ACRDUS_06245 [Mycobacterium sp.]